MRLPLLFILISLPAYAGPVGMCSAEVTYLDGHEQTHVMSCDDANAGKCFQEVVRKDGKHDLEEVSCE